MAHAQAMPYAVTAHQGQRQLSAWTTPLAPTPRCGGKVLRPRRQRARVGVVAVAADLFPSDAGGAGGVSALGAELAALVAETRASGAGASLHVVAFSGGVDSSLAAFLVHRAFTGADDAERAKTNENGTGVGREVGGSAAVAAIGVSPALPASQLAGLSR
jgi:hypothetical protein